MFRHLIKAVLIIVMTPFIIGCKTISGIEVSAYIQEKERLDQHSHGNAGYLMGSPKDKKIAKLKKMRKIYVLEISKEVKLKQMLILQNDALDDNSSGIVEKKSEKMEDELEFDDNMAMPSYEDKPMIEKGTMEDNGPSFVEYKVQTDDTLQKISKKFYDSYSQWQKIYEYNRSKIKDPNHIKPGTIIRIPKQL